MTDDWRRLRPCGNGAEAGNRPPALRPCGGLDVVSHIHGQHIYEIGYLVLPYFLEQWDGFEQVPLGVLVHSTHVRGNGNFLNGVERPRATFKLATQLSPGDCARLALGYQNLLEVNVADWQGRKDEGVLYVPKAGEMLYKVKK